MAAARELELLRRVAELEQKLDWLYRHTGNGSPYPQQTKAVPVASFRPHGASEAVRLLARRGLRAEAVERYQDESGADVITATRVVDDLH